MFKQTDQKYKTIMLGFGTGSIYLFGCYLVSLCNGLNQKGYSFTPESLNDMFKSHNAFCGPYKNYIDVANLQKYFPQLFVSFQQIDPWNDVPPTTDLLKNDLVVVCRVSAKPIGGTGDHFVLLTGINNGVAIINDPWTGATEKITNRWGKLGNILGVRIFKVIPFVPPVQPQTESTASPTPPVIGSTTTTNNFDGYVVVTDTPVVTIPVDEPPVVVPQPPPIVSSPPVENIPNTVKDNFIVRFLKWLLHL